MNFLKDKLNLTGKRLIIFEIVVIAALFLLAFLLRLHLIMTMNHPPLLTDAHNYDLMTRQFMEKGFLGYDSLKPNSYITPGYPLFLSLLYAIFGFKDASPLLQVRIAQGILGALTCLIIYFIGKSVKNRKTGFIAGLLYACYPPFIWACSLILTEVAFSFMFFLYIMLQVQVFKTRGRVLAAFSGLAFICAVMIRPVVLPVIAIAYIFYLIAYKDKTIIRTFLWAMVGVAPVLIAWWTRNLAVMHEFIFLAKGVGNPFLAGVFPYGVLPNPNVYAVEDQFKAGLKYLWEGLITAPLSYIKWFTVGKFNLLFKFMWYYPADGFYVYDSFGLYQHFMVAIGWLGALYAIVMTKANKILALLSIIAIFLTLLQLMFVADARFAYPIFGLLTILAANIVDTLLFRSDRMLIK